MSFRFSFLGAAAVATAGMACPAHATFFSFASDMNSNAYTFGGTAGTLGSFNITDFSRPNTYMLQVDDNNGVLPTVGIASEFRAALTASAGQSTNIGGSLWLHTYRVVGSFGFYNAAGNALLTVTVGPNNGGLLSVPGSQTAWSATGAVLGADTFSNLTYTATSTLITAMGGTAAAAQYGLALGDLGLPADFGFDLSVLNSGAIGLAVGIDATTKAPVAAWRSESSYSGSAGAFIPSPGSAALLTGGGAFLGLRRRRN
jgi:hypothetical protein